MMIKSFGCSFIFGSDLQDVDPRFGEPYRPPSKFTWPSLLSQSLGYNYQCHARPGSGNLRILEKILSLSAEEPALFVISWSWIDRFDYTIDLDPDKAHHYDIAGNNHWHTVVPVDTGPRAENYYRYLHSQYRDKLSSLSYIQTAISVLKNRKIPFIMTYVDNLLFETEWHSNSAIVELQNNIRPYMTTFDGLTFLEWSKQKGFPISPTFHPLEPAHQAAFEYLKSNLDKIIVNNF